MERFELRRWGIGAFAAIALLAAGCGGGDGAGQATAAATPPAAPSRTPTGPAARTPESRALAQPAETPTPEVFGTTDALSGTGVTSPTILRQLRVGRDRGFDRLVFLFDGTAVPSWSIAYVDQATLCTPVPVVETPDPGTPQPSPSPSPTPTKTPTPKPTATPDSSGATPTPTPKPPTPTRTPTPKPTATPTPTPTPVPITLQGEATLVIRFTPSMAHDNDGSATTKTELAGGTDAVISARQTCDSGNTVAWAIGVGGKQPYRVQVYDNPPRLVLDIEHP